MSIFKKKRPNFSLNTTSTADISFMLLIFFLVTSSMDVDKGIVRQLPPADDPTRTVPIQMEAANIMQISLQSDGSFAIDGTPASGGEVERDAAKFIQQRGENHIINILISPNAEYGQYFSLQEHLLKAYETARNKASIAKYKRAFSRLTETQRDNIRRAIPQRMIEKDAEYAN